MILESPCSEILSKEISKMMTKEVIHIVWLFLVSKEHGIEIPVNLFPIVWPFLALFFVFSPRLLLQCCGDTPEGTSEVLCYVK